MTDSDYNGTISSDSEPHFSGVSPVEIRETGFEYVSDIILGIAFLITTCLALKRMIISRKQGGVETTVVTAFYSLILMTSIFRALWFLIPSSMMNPTYTPSAIMAFSTEYDKWFISFLAEILVSLGSLCLFSIFILILVYWADILKKYFYPSARRVKPMMTFIILVSMLAMIEIINALCFFLRIYSIEGMILLNAVLLAIVSIICVCEISIFSHRFRKVLTTLGAINQVPTESQVKRIVWITVTGNLFFFGRALIEIVFAVYLVLFLYQTGKVDKVFSHSFWDVYLLLKHWSEVAILCLMLYILQSRFTPGVVPASRGNREGYEQVGQAEQPYDGTKVTNTLVV